MAKLKNRFVDIRRVNMKAKMLKYDRSWKQYGLAVLCMGMSFIIPDFGIGIALGIMVLSPVSILPQAKNKIKAIKLFIEKKCIMWGFK